VTSDFICLVQLIDIIIFFIFLAGDSYRQLSWGALDDVVMGGVSESTFQIDPNGSENGGPTGVFKGMCQISVNACHCTLGGLE
jgi:hypothetical protein